MKNYILAITIQIIALIFTGEAQSQTMNKVGKVSTGHNTYVIENGIGPESRLNRKVRNASNKFTDIKATRSGYAKDQTHITPNIIFNIKIDDIKAVLKTALPKKRWSDLSDEVFFIDLFINNEGRVVDLVFLLADDTRITASDIEKVEVAFKSKFHARITSPAFIGTFNYLTFGSQFRARELLTN